ncbi:MAG: DUF3301 domain-containing protein [Rudaea sp.]|uniref:DUF3301 domain-containing protein n=1 Tax=Rudaea sp. TaxID=2136325 RepID=UPI0039E3839B
MPSAHRSARHTGIADTCRLIVGYTGLMIGPMLSVILLLAVLALWQNALKARDLARSLGHDLCARAGVQLLDQSVSLAGVGFARNDGGRLRLRRNYRFEVSLDGHDRHRGSLTMLDGHLLAWSLPTIETRPAIRTSNVIELPRRPN